MIKKFINLKNILVAILIFTVNIASATVSQKNPYEMIDGVANQLFKDLSEANSKGKIDDAVAQKIIEKDLMPYINYKYAGYKVLGSHIKKTTSEQRIRFVEVFRGYLVDTFSGGLVGIAKDKFELKFAPAKPFKDLKSLGIKLQIATEDQNQEPYNVEFKLRKNKKTNDWFAYDVIAEGISLLSTKQSEFSGLLREKGIDEVIKMLEHNEIEATIKSDKK